MDTSFQKALSIAQTHAQSGRFPEMLAACQQIVEIHGDNVDTMLDVGALLMSFGFLARARECFERVI